MGKITFLGRVSADDPQFSLIVDFGDPNHMHWLDQLAGAQITDIRG
jgi:hypothetical protein